MVPMSAIPPTKLVRLVGRARHRLVLCTFLYTGEQLAASPMQLVGLPMLAKPLPKHSPAPQSKRS